MDNLEYQIFYRRHLPHYQPPGAHIFVTFRLAGSIPEGVKVQLREESVRIEARLRNVSDHSERQRQLELSSRRMFGDWDKYLDCQPDGLLRDPLVASLISESISRRDREIYCLDAFCIMPNHVHLVFQPLEKKKGSYYSLSEIMHSLKRYTARQANQILGREGQFWQHENYDHVVRDEAEHDRIINYVIVNPVKAGLVEHWKDWEWTYCKYEFK